MRISRSRTTHGMESSFQGVLGKQYGAVWDAIFTIVKPHSVQGLHHAADLNEHRDFLVTLLAEETCRHLAYGDH